MIDLDQKQQKEKIKKEILRNAFRSRKFPIRETKDEGHKMFTPK